MPANLTATGIRVFIGNDDQEWTDFIDVLDLGYSERDRGGIFFTEGQLVLVDAIGSPESLNARKNPARWARGTRVKIDINNGRGWERHPMGWVYILKEPLPPHPDNPKITIPLGCILRLRDYKQPDEDKSGVELGSATGVGTIIQNLLNAASITFNHAGDITTLNQYKLDVPLQKQDVGSFVAQAGELAYSFHHAVYQTNQGTIRIRPLSIAPTTPLFTVSIGDVYHSDAIGLDVEYLTESEYAPLEGAETPADKVKATGNKKSADFLKGIIKTTTIEYTPANAIDPNAGQTPVIGKITNYEEITYSRRKEIIQTIFVPLGLQNGSVFPKDQSLALAEYSKTTYYYRANESAVLYKEETISTKQIASASGEFASALIENFLANETLKLRNLPVDVQQANQEALLALIRNYLKTVYVPENKIITYQYDSQSEVVKRIKTEVYQSAAVVVSDEGDFGLLAESVPGLIEETRWFNYGDENYWKQETSKYEPIGKAFPSIEYPETPIPSNPTPSPEEIQAIREQDKQRRIFAKKSLVNTLSEIKVSNSGQCNPPSAERAPMAQTEKEEPIEGVAEFKTAGTDEQERERTIQVPYAISKEQLTRIAQTEGALLIGKRLGQQFQTPIPDALIDNPYPIPQIVSIETDGTTYQFLADGIEYSHTPNSAILGFNGIWLANLPAQPQLNQPQPYFPESLVPPYQELIIDAGTIAVAQPAISTITVNGGLVHGGTIEHLPYDLVAPAEVVIRGGLVHGGRSFRSFETLSNGVAANATAGGGITVIAIRTQGNGVLGNATAGGGVTTVAVGTTGNGVTAHATAGGGTTATSYQTNGNGATSYATAGSGVTSVSYQTNGNGAVSDALAGGGITTVGISTTGNGVITDAIVGGGSTTTTYQGNGNGVLANATVGGGSTVVSANYESETNELLARFGGTYNTTRQNAINDFIKWLKDNSLWATIDALYLLASPTQADALLNWKSTSFNLTVTGSITFTAEQGIAVPSNTANRLNTGYTPSTAGGNLTQNSATIGIYSLTDSLTNNQDMGSEVISGGVRRLSIRARATSNNQFASGLNCDVIEVTAAAIPNSLGWFSASRTGASVQAQYRNGAIVQSGTTASVGLSTQPIAIGAFNSGGVFSAGSGRQHAAVVLASGWTHAQNTAFYRGLATYLAAVGTITLPDWGYFYTASSSSVYNSLGHLSPNWANLVDNVGGTGSATNQATNQFIQADLGSAQSVSSVRVGGGNIPSWGGVAVYLNNRLIQYSNDGTNWTTAATITGITDSGGSQFVTFSFSSVSARYWRIFFASSAFVATTEFLIKP